VTGILVALMGGLGALARYGLEGVIAQRQRTPFPLSTLAVNVTGSGALGAIAGSVAAGHAGASLLLYAGTGFLGGYTTFSTFTYETLRLLEDGAWRLALWNIALAGPLSFIVAGASFLLAKGA
jgi:fluoride exporter